MSEPDAPILNIEGELVALGPLRRDLIPLYLRWITDFGTTQNLLIQPRPMTLEQETAWFDHATSDDAGFTFTIYERATARAIGNCGVHGISMPHRRAEVGIMIGEQGTRGHGYGTESMRLLLDFAFTAVGLHSVMLSVFEYNHAARRCYEKVGFQEIGRRRQARWHNGRFWDELFMDILTTEFESPVLQDKLQVELPRP